MSNSGYNLRPRPTALKNDEDETLDRRNRKRIRISPGESESEMPPRGRPNKRRAGSPMESPYKAPFSESGYSGDKSSSNPNNDDESSSSSDSDDESSSEDGDKPESSDKEGSDNEDGGAGGAGAEKPASQPSTPELTGASTEYRYLYI